MNIRFLGKWSSNLVAGERNVCFLLDDKIAFDFGPHSVEALLEKGVDPNSINMLLISHMHLDHYAGVAELLWYRSIYSASNQLLIVGPAGIRKSTEELLKLYQTPEPWYIEQLDDHIEYLEDNAPGFIQIFHSNHTVPTNAYRIEYDGSLILYSGDTAYSENVVRGAREVDWLIHEMTYTDEDRKLADLWRHSTCGDALRVFKESEAKHLVPVHLTRESSSYAKKMSSEIEGLVYPLDTLEL